MTHNLILLTINMVIISLVSFGGGATALFYDFGVTRMGWITSGDLSAILGFGYATPGPAVFGIAIFLGYSIAGWWGAIVGSISIFVMPWLLALIAAKHLGSLLEKQHAPVFIKSVGLAAAGIVIYTAVNLMPAGSSSNLLFIGIAVLSFGSVVIGKVHPLVILLAAGLLSFFIR